MALFDIKLVDNKNITYSTTFKNYGWYAVFRILNDSVPGPLRLISGETNYVARYDDLFIDADFIMNDNMLQFIFLIKNIGNTPQTVDLGLFADIQIGNNDNANVKILEYNRGLAITDPISNISYSIIIRDYEESSSVDTFFYGPYSSKYDSLIGAPFFEDGVEKITNSIDTVTAFSWKNRKVLPNETINLSFKIFEGSAPKTPPKIYILDDLKAVYQPNETINIVIVIYDIDGEPGSIYFSDSNGIITTRNYKFNKRNYALEFFNINVGTKPYYNFTLYAVDESNYTSEIITKKVRVQNSIKNTMNLPIFNHVKKHTLFNLRRRIGR